MISPELIARIIKFGIVGLSGMVVDFGTTWLLREKLRWNQYFANSCGFTLAVINNYILNRVWTFESNQSWETEFGRFALFSLVGLGLNNLIVYILHEKLGLNFYVSKAMAIVCVFAWNFISNYLFTFR